MSKTHIEFTNQPHELVYQVDQKKSEVQINMNYVQHVRIWYNKDLHRNMIYYRGETYSVDADIPIVIRRFD